MEILSLGLFALFVAAGARIAAWFDDGPLLDRLCIGAPIGIALASLVAFALASFIGLTPVSIAVTAAGLLPLFFIGPRPARALRPAPVVAAVLVGVALFAFFDRAMIERREGIFTGDDNNLGDFPFHVAIINSFAKAENFPPEHPELSGVRLTYPILADFGVAVHVRAGAGLRLALLGHNLALALSLVGVVYLLTRRLTGSPLAAALAPPLLLLSGGLGFFYFLREVPATAGGAWGLLWHLPHNYTITWTGELRWGNALTTLLMTQRSLLLGMPLVLVVVMLWWRGAVEEADPHRSMLWAGAVAGLLPLSHAHSYAVVLGIGACLALLFPRYKAWRDFFLAALALGLPQSLWLARGSSTLPGRFLAWEPGWDHGTQHPVLFWLFNAGLFIPVLMVAWPAAPPKLRRFVAPFLLLFVVPNLLRLSPSVWDNVKFLIYWYALSVVVVALWLARLLEWPGWRRGMGASLVCLLVASGALDVWRVASRQIEVPVFDAHAVTLAREVLDHVPPRSLVLHIPGYDSPVYLSGRRSILGYRGHIWSQGLDEGTRESDIKTMYAGGPAAGPLLERWGVDYILVGPGEQATLQPDPAYLARFPVVGQIGPYRLYRAR